MSHINSGSYFHFLIKTHRWILLSHQSVPNLRFFSRSPYLTLVWPMAAPSLHLRSRFAPLLVLRPLCHSLQGTQCSGSHPNLTCSAQATHVKMRSTEIIRKLSVPSLAFTSSLTSFLFQCQHCDKAFMNYSFLQSHMQRRHPEECDISMSFITFFCKVHLKSLVVPLD